MLFYSVWYQELHQVFKIENQSTQFIITELISYTCLYYINKFTQYASPK